MPHRRTLAAVATASVLTLSLAATTLAQGEIGPPQATPMPVPAAEATGDGTAIRLTTELGDVVIALFNESAPVAAENFQNLAEAGFYDDVGFHRVVPGFVVQGGDPDGTGAGGPPFRISDELVVGTYERGVVAMARTDQPDSQGSQFFFVIDDSAAVPLDSANTYAIFGRVVEGMDVVDAIVEANPPSNQVEDPVKILSASVEQIELPEEPAQPAARAAVNALAGTLPTSVGELDTSRRQIFTSDQIQARVAPSGLEGARTVAEEQGTDLSALSIAAAGSQGGDDLVNILAAQLPGVPADLFSDELAPILIGDPSTFEITEEVIGGRDVTSYSPSPEAAPADITYRVLSDDIVYYVNASEDILEDAIAALP